jgi:hypothetical protein
LVVILRVTKEERIKLASRIEAAYQPKFDPLDGGVNAWASPTHVGVEIMYDKTRRRPWATSARYARRQWPIGRLSQFRPIEEAAAQVQSELDAYLREVEEIHKQSSSSSG